MNREGRCRSCGSGAIEWSRIRCHGKAVGVIGILLGTMSVLGFAGYVRFRMVEDSMTNLPASVIQDMRITRGFCLLLFLFGAPISWALLRKKRVWQCGDCGDASILPK